MFRPCSFIAPKDFTIVWLSNLDKLKTIAIEAQRKLDEKTRYTKEPSKPVEKTKEKVSVL
jgi:hypothetical protein